MKQQQQHDVQLAESQLFQVSGGAGTQLTLPDNGVIETPKEPVYITLAIGEGGGKLPDNLS
ncbi:hypothetical protein [Alteromonas sp. 009811495]|jgi:hypothetical protein|uniref:hypothetical protein n=1 Tax=Alteromonas sp. 009811495 TaxID=3002962 RepID=UPI00237D4048|nr:hypothetical protein [Alteromonas sp. 009811495]WDT85682.1 hypothetical protein OZ660_17390 [Alteromonas sp. 009811495]